MLPKTQRAMAKRSSDSETMYDFSHMKFFSFETESVKNNNPVFIKRTWTFLKQPGAKYSGRIQCQDKSGEQAGVLYWLP